MTRQLDVLFISPNSSKLVYQDLAYDVSAIEVPVWALLLAQSCRKVGFGVAILDADAERLTPKQVAQRVKDMKPRLACFVAYGGNPNSGTTNMAGVVKEAAAIKDYNYSQKICVVGSHASALPLEVLQLEPVDFVLLNEGVYALRRLLATDLESDLQYVKGIGWKERLLGFDSNHDELHLNEPQSIVPQEKMDHDLPGYAWDLLPKHSKPLDMYRAHIWHPGYIEKERTPAAALYTSLGCKFKCDFCLDANTKIITSRDRSRKAKDIQVGDKLVGFDTEQEQIAETEVKAISSRVVDTILEICLSDGKTIRTTPEHPFLVDGQWIEAQYIQLGHKLLVISSHDKMALRMQLQNPMYNSESATKAGQTNKALIANGIHTPFMCTEKGRSIIGEKARKRALSQDNPMLRQENKDKASLRMRGDKNPSWQGGISTMFQEYPVEFSISLRKRIRKRDNRTCQECGKQKCKLDVHHIDYDKFNNNQCNLITLCSSCHTKTNFHRDVWMKHYQEKMQIKGNCPHYVEVTQIKQIHEQITVVNFHCEPHNNFFANYILSHNCMINIVNRVDNGPNVSAANSNTMRFWSPEFIIKEFDKLVEMGVATIRISDEMHLLNRQYFEPLHKLLIERGYGKFIKTWIYSRVDTVQPKYLDMFQKSGVKWLALGIEAASQKIRQEITKGKFKEVDIRQVVKLVHDSGMDVGANYIFGFPNETIADLQQTLDLAIELNTANANMYNAAALPGSPLYFQAKQYGWQLPDTFEGYGFLSYDFLPLRTNYLTAAEVLDFRDKAWHQYFERPAFLGMIEGKFGKDAADNIRKVSQIQLKRKILGHSQ